MAEPASLFAGGSEGSASAGMFEVPSPAAGGLALPRVGKRGAPQAFARKLYEILTTESTSVIAWNEQGTAFHVKDVDTFSEQTLTRYYRHSKFSSFQRQLNLYSFRKIVKGPDTGGYAHAMFHRDRPDDLYHVRRSISGSSSKNAPAAGAALSGGGEPGAMHQTSVVTGVVPTSSSAAPVAARKGAGRAAQKATTASWTPPRAYKSKAAARRTGKVRHAIKEPKHHTKRPTQKQRKLARTPSSIVVAAAVISKEVLGERGAWTTGESSSDNESDPELGDGGQELSSDDEGELCSSIGEPCSEADSDDSGSEAGGRTKQVREKLLRAWANTEEASGEAGAVARRDLSLSRLFSKRFSYGNNSAAKQEGAGGNSRRGERQGDGVKGEEGGVATSTSPQRSSPISSFFKKTFSGGSFFMENHHRRGSNSVDMGVAETDIPTTPTPLRNASSPSSQGTLDGESSTLDHDAAGSDESMVQGGSVDGKDNAGGRRPSHGAPVVPPVSVNGKDAQVAAAESAAMPPPRTPGNKRDSREELGLVEQLTNMVEVFDICDLLRRVSTSGRPLDKDGNKLGGSGPFGSRPSSSQHLRQMSVDTDAGVPVSPQERDGSAGLPSLASMELMRDSSRDWDTLMAGSADVSDLGNTMVQSVAEFFSF